MTQGLTEAGKRQATREEVRAWILEIVSEIEQVQRLQMRAITSSTDFLARRVRAKEAELVRVVVADESSR
jgi:hypothetical protein